MISFSFCITRGYMNRILYIEIRVYSLFLIFTADILTYIFLKSTWELIKENS